MLISVLLPVPGEHQGYTTHNSDNPLFLYSFINYVILVRVRVTVGLLESQGHGQGLRVRVIVRGSESQSRGLRVMVSVSWSETQGLRDMVSGSWLGSQGHGQSLRVGVSVSLYPFVLLDYWRFFFFESPRNTQTLSQECHPAVILCGNDLGS